MDKNKGKKKKRREVTLSYIRSSDFVTQEWQTYIRNLSLSIDTSRLDQIQAYTNFNKANNELKFEWFLLNIRKENHSIRPDLALFLKETGRRKYILPLYKALCEHPKDKGWAVSIFKQSKGGYHSVSRKSIEAVFAN